MQHSDTNEQEFSLKKLFVPLTNVKAIHWIILIGLCVYANMLVNGFVWDDLGYVINYSPVHSIHFLFAFTRNMYNTGSQFRPIPVIYFSIIYTLFQNTAFFYHLLQLALHIVNTVLVFYLFMRFFKKSLSFFLSVIFMIHPLQVESVSYIASIDNLLFFLFGILACILGMEAKLSVKKIIIIYTLALVAMLTKETGVVFILIILLYRILYTRSQILINLYSGIISIILYFLIRLSSVGIYYKQAVLSPIAGLSLMDRMLNLPSIFFYYLSNFFYPNRLATDQLWIIKNINFTNFYVPLISDGIFLILLALLGFYLYKKQKRFTDFIFFLLWFLIGMGVYSQIVPLDFTVNDRWFYFPIVGLLGIVGFGIQSFNSSIKNYNISLLICVCIILLLSVRTIIRNSNWSNNMTLFTHDNRIVDNYDIENNIGSEYFLQHDYGEALTYYLRSQELLPYEVNTYNVGVTYEQLGNIPLALKYYDTVVHQKNFLIDTVYKQYAYVAVAKIYSFREKPNNVSVRFIEEGLQAYPESGYLWAALANEEYQLGKRNDALKAAYTAKNILPTLQTDYIYQQILNNKPLLFE